MAKFSNRSTRGSLLRTLRTPHSPENRRSCLNIHRCGIQEHLRNNCGFQSLCKDRSLNWLLKTQTISKTSSHDTFTTITVDRSMSTTTSAAKCRSEKSQKTKPSESPMNHQTREATSASSPNASLFHPKRVRLFGKQVREEQSLPNELNRVQSQKKRRSLK